MSNGTSTNQTDTRTPGQRMTTGEFQGLYDRVARLREEMTARLAPDLALNPQLGDLLNNGIDNLLEQIAAEQRQSTPPPDRGVAQMVGIGAEAVGGLENATIPQGVESYDETVTSERIMAVGDLYYLWSHEALGVWKAINKLKELFMGGTARLSDGPGAFALYRFDRREVLRYTQRDRLAAYRRAFGYGGSPLPPGSHPNTDFHGLFTRFNREVALYWRDKRVSDVIRERSYDPSFGSIAVVRRAGLDLRNNLKFTSYGHLNVLRVEAMQLLDEAFNILNAPDIKNLFGAETAWEVIEDILVQHYKQKPVTSPRQRMAEAGRAILNWLAQPYVLQTQRSQFETLLLPIAEHAEEWLVSAQTLGLADFPAPNQQAMRVTRSRGETERQPVFREYDRELMTW